MRCVVGTIGFTSITFGVALVPLVVQNTIFNTAPFWASLLGWLFLKESITTFEIIAMILSFGGVVTIALSSRLSQDDPTSETAEEESTSTGM